MQKFFIKLGVFLLLLILLSFSLDSAISTGLKEMEEYRFQTWTDIVDSKINADVLIMGNSRAFSHYSPEILDSVLHLNSYNLGIGGHPFNVQLLRYKMYEEHNKLPKVIIMNVDFFTFKTAIIGHEREQVFPYIRDSVMRSNLPNLGFSWAEINLPLYRYFGYQMVVKDGLLEFFHIHHYHNQPSIKGYRPQNGKWNPTILNKLETVESVADPKIWGLFENFLFDCNRKHIKVVLVYSPVYYKAMQKLKNKEKFDLLILKISKKYKLPFLDYSQEPICKDSNYFCVAIHLNENGAKFFSRKLANDLMSVIK